jgi:glycosyltransferase involved in cell wall biosynthesis
MPPEPHRTVIVTARDEADRIQATIASLRAAFPGARIVLAESGSRDATPALAARAGAEVVRTSSRRKGKGGSATTAALAALASPGAADATFLFCDGDLGSSAGRLSPLVDAVEAGRCDLAVAAFSRRLGGGFGVAVGFARWAIRDLTGLETRAPISGQRALRGSSLERVLPFADGFGMEIGMTVDAARAGLTLEEVEIDLDHRATMRSLTGFAHRARQLLHFLRTYTSRRHIAKAGAAAHRGR